MMRHLDLFSGIGGFALAAQMVGGIETVGFCEIDPWARKVLNKNFPGVPIHDDVKTLEPNEYGTIGLITGGYPCQPFSQAGERRGKEDDRHLWPEVFRLVKGLRPRWCLFENVAGHVTLGLDEVLSDLENIGYSARAVIIPACAVDAGHRRDRVWIITNSGSERREGANGEFIEADTERASERKQKRGVGGTYQAQAVTSDTNGPRSQRGIQDGCPDEKGRKIPSYGLTPERSNWWDWSGSCRWEPEPGVGRLANGIPKRVDRLRGLGNAIVPQVAAEILKVMLEVDKTK